MGRWALGALVSLCRPLKGVRLPGWLLIVAGVLVLPWVLAGYLLWLRLAFTKLGGLEFLLPIR